MVDYFKTNWTEKIKRNPVANKILNPKTNYGGLVVRQAVLDNYEFENNHTKTKIKKIQKTKGDGFYVTEQRLKNLLNDKDRPPTENEIIQQYHKQVEDVRLGKIAAHSVVLPPKNSVIITADPTDKHFQEPDYFGNMYVDFMNIHHPKLRVDYIQALSSQPLNIKPPSVFFSDV